MQLHILDAEPAQGMQEEHTSVAPAGEKAGNQELHLTDRFRCVGNAMPGLVRSAVATVSATCQMIQDDLRTTAPALVQVLGELFHRMCHVRNFPSRLVTRAVSLRFKGWFKV
jgi:hypothetical protein